MRQKTSIKRRNTRFPAALVLALAILLASGCQKAEQPATQPAAEPAKKTAQPPAAAIASGPIECGNVTILDTRTDLGDTARAKQNVEDTLTRYPDVNCLVGLWSYNGPAILSALRDAGKAGKIPVVCFDEEADTLEGVRKGEVHATVVQQPFEFGYQSVRILAAIARGDRSVIPKSGIYDVPVRVINKDNVDAFAANLKEMLAGAPAESENAQGDVHLSFVTNNVASFWNIALAGIRKAEKDLKATCEFHMNADGTPTGQQRIVEALIAKGCQGMAISPVDPKNQVDLINQACKVMAVITQDSDAADSHRLCYVGTNNYMAGREAGKLIREALPNGGKIMIFVGRLDAQNAVERRQGIIDELSGKPLPQAPAS